MKRIRFDNQPRLQFEEFESQGQEVSREEERSVSPSEMEDTGDSPAPLRRKLHYISFASGSSGNSCYIGTDEGGIIIDAGIRTDSIEDTLRRHGVSMHKVKALVLTHDHSDHVRYSYNLLRNNRHMTLYCTPRVLNGLLRRHSISRRIKEYHTPIFKEIPFTVGGMELTAFEVPHDGSDNMGFSIDFDGRRFVLATDLGEISPRARAYMSMADYLVIESNYDSEMLRLGPYPEYLKARIRSANGHMDNIGTANFLAEIAGPRLKYIFLCHLSQDNNTPELALRASRAALRGCGFKVGNARETLTDRQADLQLMVLPRFEPTRWFVFR